MLQEIFDTVNALVSTELLVALGVGSGLLFVLSLVVIPIILVRLPEAYFDERYPRTWMKDHHPVLRTIGLVLKNLFGAVFLLAGLAMLVLPGQGILTILIGISLLDFPGKRRLEARLVGQATLFKAINAMRKKFGRPSFTLAPKAENPPVSDISRHPSATPD